MQNEAAPRIAPILPSEWDETVLDALGAFPTSLKFVLTQWNLGAEGDIRGMHVLGLFAHYPALAKAFMTFNAHVSGASKLSRRVRELVILRASWLRFSEYELVQHIILGRRAGLTDEEIARVQDGPDAPGWAPEDADLVRAVDEMQAYARIGDATWERLSRHYDATELMDLIFLVGCYSALALAINTFRMPLEPKAPPLDAATKARLLAAKPSVGAP